MTRKENYKKKKKAQNTEGPQSNLILTKNMHNFTEMENARLRKHATVITDAIIYHWEGGWKVDTTVNKNISYALPSYNNSTNIFSKSIEQRRIEGTTKQMKMKVNLIIVGPTH